MNKNILLRSTILALGLEGSLSADTWDFGAGTQNWTDALNWSADVVPAANVNATINHAVVGETPIISTAVDRTGFDTWIGQGTAGILDINAGGSVNTSTKWIFVGQNTGGNGTLNVNSGGSLTSDNDVRLGTNPASGQLSVNGGTVTVGRVVSGTLGTISVSNGGKLTTTNAGAANGSPDIVRLTTSAFGAGSLVQGARSISFATGSHDISGGTIDAADQVFCGQGLTNTLAMSSGTMSCNNWMVVGIGTGGNGTLNFSGGTINATDTSTTAFTTVGANSDAIGVINQSGGTYNQGGAGIVLGEGGTAQGTYTLNGGDLHTKRIWSNNGNAALNLNGGTLHGTADEADFISSNVTVDIQSGGAKIDSNGFNLTSANPMPGTGSLEKLGTGTLSLTSDTTYTGATTVTAGRLVFGGVPTTSGLTVADGAGIGVEDPFGTLGTLAVPTASFGAGASLNIETDSDNFSESLIVTSSSGLSFSTLGVNLYLDGSTNSSFGGTYTLIEYSGSFTGNVGNITVLNPRPGYSYTFADTGSAITVEVVAGDTDGDGMDDLYEQNNGLDYQDPSDAGGNLDGDFATNLEEYTAGTDPNDPNDDPNNTDSDGLRDSWEVANFGNLTAQTGTGDPDGDLATNAEELAADTDPLSGDSWPDDDNDQMNDAWENAFLGGTGTSDGTADTDNDGFTDLEEHDASTDPSIASGSGISPIWTTLKHRWSFNDVNMTDSVGGSDATIVDVGPNGVTFNDAINPTTVTMTGGAKADSDYIKLGENLLPNSTTPVTIELWAKQNSIQNWSRIFDFHSSTNEYLMMAWTQGTNTATDRLEFRDTTSTPTGNVIAPLQISNVNQPYGTTEEHHIVVTLEPLVGSGGKTRVSVYSAPSTADDLGPAKAVAETTANLVNLNDALNALGYSPWNDNTANATYNEVRIWNGALSGWMADKMHDLGSDAITVVDSDGDHLPDDWELQYFVDLNGTNDLDADTDADTFTDYEEYVAGSNPNNILVTPDDTDGDGLADDWEIQYFGNLDQDGSGDPDGDGLTNEQEETGFTDPTDDEDGLSAGWETFFFGSTTTQDGDDDSDGDGFTNAEEYFVSQPNNILSTPDDVNGDGVLDTDSTQHTLAFSDVLGTTSFNSGLNWDDALAPTSGETYIVAIPNLRTPAAAADITFAGARLDLVEVFNGRPSLLLKYDGATPITTTLPLINLNGGEIQNAAQVGIVHHLAGTINVTGPVKSYLATNNGGIVVDAVVTGSGSLELYNGNSVTFNAENTFTGNLNVINDNGLILGETGSLSFVVGASGENNVISGTGPVTLNGSFNLDLTGATSTEGDEWDLVTTTGAVTIGTTFSVNGFTAGGGAVGSRIWTDGTYQYDEATGILSFGTGSNDSDADGMDDAWETTYGLNVGIDDSADDLDADGTDNLTEFRLNLIPNDGTSRFEASLNGAEVSWQGVAGLSFTVQRSTDLVSWSNRTTVVGVDGTNTYTDPAPVPGKAFYRVLLNP